MNCDVINGKSQDDGGMCIRKSFIMSYLLVRYYYDDKIKKNRLSRAFSTYRR
jgi:hypothetical protein